MGKVIAEGIGAIVDARASSPRGVAPVGTTPVSIAIAHELRGNGTQPAVTNTSDLRNPLKGGSVAFTGGGGGTINLLDVREATRIFFQGRVKMTPGAQLSAKPRYRVFGMRFDVGEALARVDDADLSAFAPRSIMRLDAAGMADAGAVEIDVPTATNIDEAGIGSVALAHANGYAFTPWVPGDSVGLDVRGLDLVGVVPDVQVVVQATDTTAFEYQLLALTLN